MKVTARIATSAALLVLTLSVTGCAKLKARDRLNKGIQAFKAGQYERATDLFQESIQLDPSYPAGHLYLATAYSYQVVPNLDTPDNLKIARKALDGFDDVLKNNPNDLDALRQEASIYRNIKQYDKAKQIELKIISSDPKDYEANYTIGDMAWNQAYKNTLTILAQQGLTDDGDGNAKKSKDTCQKLVAANAAPVSEAIQYLNQAVNIKPNYDDAMSMLNLSWRQKANLECGNDDARKADLDQAQQWVQRAMGARRANEEAKEKKLGGGVSMK